ncbi:MAG: hypothetical protein ABIO81_12675 [Ginsengibacter sp.]
MKICKNEFWYKKRFGAAVAFLCTPAAAYISGIQLPVEGGKLQPLIFIFEYDYSIFSHDY